MSRIDLVNATARRLAAVAIITLLSGPLGAGAAAWSAQFDDMVAAAPVGHVAIASYDDVPAIPEESPGADPFDAAALTDEACMQQLRQCCCCPGWTHYAIFDVLFLQRANAGADRPLVIENALGPNPGAVLLSTADLQYPVAPGVRLFYGELGPDNIGWEVGYLGVWSMFADAGVIGADTLRLPGPIGDLPFSGFDEADQVRATTISSLNMVEANLFTYCCCRKPGVCNPCRCPCTCTNWLFGFRWAGLQEAASLDTTCCEGDPPVPYRVTTCSQMLGPQVGYRRRKQWDCWAYEGWAKAGLMGTVLSQSQGALVEPFTGIPVREPRSSSRTGVGMIGDINFTVIRRLNETWGLRAGYNLIWLQGVALAADQWDFTNTAASGTRLVGDGGIFLHGANLGLEARW